MWVFMKEAEIATHPCKGHGGIRYLCRDGPENAAYRAIAFSGSEPELEREKVLGYNQLVDHVGIHGQRSLTEALSKDSLVR
ncbi:hypothetical protein Taro_041781 [Colocasia esculenta]|uniref:Uncharacterized protein n=1 Tax=Colocasia esculenta TaxID=4460 RepID=A0A843WCB7_COLES|nr:hypothetical protein [Colocasia esculenta]